jgi:molybdate transport system substrate-binding protein
MTDRVVLHRRYLLGLAMASGLASRSNAQDRGLFVFAAISLREAMDEIGKAWSRTSGKTEPRASYAASGALARQIENGAPADIFVSADIDWMDHLERRGLIRPGTRAALLGNRLVMIAAKDSTAQVRLERGLDLTPLLGRGRLAMATIDTVPAGRYGKAALENLGMWRAVENRVAQADNVRAAMAFVARGDAPLGIVYATDAAADPTVKVVALFPADSHPPIVYPMAIPAESRHPDAAAFHAHLRSDGAAAIFERHGFSVLVHR